MTCLLESVIERQRIMEFVGTGDEKIITCLLFFLSSVWTKHFGQGTSLPILVDI